MKFSFSIVVTLILVGAGCGGASSVLTSTGVLPNDFYGYMHWTHEDPGQNALQWTIGFEADVVLEFSGSGNGRWDVSGLVIGNPNTYECSGSSPEVSCELYQIGDGVIEGEAFEDSDLLIVELSWKDGSYPIEVGKVSVPGPFGAITSQTELAVANTDLVSEFVGAQWTVPLVGAVFLDDAAILASDLESGTYADIELTYGLPPDDPIVSAWQAKVAAKTFASEQPLYGIGYGTFYLFGGDPRETVMRSLIE